MFATDGTERDPVAVYQGRNSKRHFSRHLTSLKNDDEHSEFNKFSFEFSCCSAILNILIFTHFIAPFVKYAYEILHEKISIPMK